MTIGQRLKMLRNAKNITQVNLAKVLHVNPNTIIRHEKGETVPDIYIVVDYADYYNVSLDYLINGKKFKDRYA